MWQIERDLYLGDEVDARSRELLEERGITHILNCAEEVPCFFRQDFLYLHLKMTDPDAAFIEYIAELCTFIDRGATIPLSLLHWYSAEVTASSVPRAAAGPANRARPAVA